MWSEHGDYHQDGGKLAQPRSTLIFIFMIVRAAAAVPDNRQLQGCDLWRRAGTNCPDHRNGAAHCT